MRRKMLTVILGVALAPSVAYAQYTSTVARHVQSAASLPLTCSSSTSVKDVIWRNSVGLSVCTALNTWTAAISGDGTLSTLTISGQALTAGTMTVTNSANVRTVIHRYDWTNAMIVALGAVTAGDVTVCTLPAKTVVSNMYVVIDTSDTSANALTVAVGRTSSTYIDYIVASDAKAAANTVYGDASGERGTNLTGYDLPSITGTTSVVAHFVKTTTNLSTVLGSTGHVYLVTATLP